MGDLVIEGTWEEVAGRAREFTGRRVRVTVLDEKEPSLTLDGVLALLIEEAETLSHQLSTPTSALRGDAWAEDVVDKFRRQGFEL